ncbi:unnamed protein product, partial [Vitis vinifera]
MSVLKKLQLSFLFHFSWRQILISTSHGNNPLASDFHIKDKDTTSINILSNCYYDGLNIFISNRRKICVEGSVRSFDTQKQINYPFPKGCVSRSISEFKHIMEGSVFTPSLEGMKHVKSETGEMLTKPFLDVCKLILPVIDKFGAAMALVKSDIGGNISRLEDKYSSNPTEFNLLYSMVEVEVAAKTAKGSSSCTNGLLWLTRAMEFLVELFHNLLQHPDWTMSQVCTDSYGKTLKQWHGWLASSSFSLAMKLAPDRKKFMDVISGTGDVNADMEAFCTSFSPFLEENHKFLASKGLDNLKAS